MERTCLDVVDVHHGSVVCEATDGAYRHVMVEFPTFAEREAFLNDLPAHTRWNRAPFRRVTLHLAE